MIDKNVNFLIGDVRRVQRELGLATETKELWKNKAFTTTSARTTESINILINDCQLRVMASHRIAQHLKMR